MSTEPHDSPTRTRRRTGLRVGAIVAVALAVAFVVWLVAGDGDGDESPATATRTVEATPARAATAEEISTLARSLDHPLYWAGPLPNRTYELTRTRSGRVYIRYLARGAEVGDQRPRHLTVGTYPQANGYAALLAAAQEPGAVTRRAAGGALIVYNRDRPRSVYFSFPRARFQVEVFSPDAQRARRLTYSGRIERVR